MKSFVVRFAALAIVAAHSTAAVPPLTCQGKIPVHQRSCTLDLISGSVAEFVCSNPMPAAFPRKLYNWEGKEKDLVDLFGKGATIQAHGNKYTLKIPENANQVSAGITCSQANRTASQTDTSNNLSPDEAKKLSVNSLVIRVNGGHSYSRDEAKSDSAYTSKPCVLTSVLVGVAALSVLI